MTYKFYDADPTGKEEYDISGEEYQKLLDVCFQYCVTMTFIAHITTPGVELFPSDLAESRLPAPLSSRCLYGHYGLNVKESSQRKDYEIRCYRLSGTVQKYLRTHVNGVFEWINGWGYSNPEDPAFLREDGSVFFCSTIHEGECTLLPNKNESISDVLKRGKWIAIDP